MYTFDDSFYYVAETNRMLQSNYIPVKKKKKDFRNSHGDKTLDFLLSIQKEEDRV